MQNHSLFQHTPSLNFFNSKVFKNLLIWLGSCPCASVFQQFLLWSTFINVILFVLSHIKQHKLLAQSYDLVLFFPPSDVEMDHVYLNCTFQKSIMQNVHHIRSCCLWTYGFDKVIIFNNIHLVLQQIHILWSWWSKNI